MLAVGACGDAVVCEVEEGRFPLVDNEGEERQGRRHLLPRAVIRARGPSGWASPDRQ